MEEGSLLCKCLNYSKGFLVDNQFRCRWRWFLLSLHFTMGRWKRDICDTTTNISLNPMKIEAKSLASDPSISSTCDSSKEIVGVYLIIRTMKWLEVKQFCDDGRARARRMLCYVNHLTFKRRRGHIVS